MKDRVNLQYSIYVDDLQDELYRLVERGVKSANTATKSLQSWFKQIKDEPNNLISSAAADELMQIRQDLLDADYLLHDAGRMISSYVAYRMEKATPAAVAGAAPSEDTPSPSAVNPMANLQEALSQLPGAEHHEGGPPGLDELAQKLAAFRETTKGL
jgi:hypothetical protein